MLWQPFCHDQHVADAGEAILQLKAVSKHFGAVRALEKVDFDDGIGEARGIDLFDVEKMEGQALGRLLPDAR